MKKNLHFCAPIGRGIMIHRTHKKEFVTKVRSRLSFRGQGPEGLDWGYEIEARRALYYLGVTHYSYGEGEVTNARPPGRHRFLAHLPTIYPPIPIQI